MLYEILSILGHFRKGFSRCCINVWIALDSFGKLLQKLRQLTHCVVDIVDVFRNKDV
jgi:hypothetical protein